MPLVAPAVDRHSGASAKIALFRSLFRGRDDVYPRRFESRKTGEIDASGRLQRFLVLTLDWAAAGIQAGHGSRSREEASVIVSMAEFPEYSSEVWRQQRNGLANKWIDARLADEPATQALAELLEQNQVDDALRVLR